jgi:hypothetical protein
MRTVLDVAWHGQHAAASGCPRDLQIVPGPERVSGLSARYVQCDCDKQQEHGRSRFLERRKEQKIGRAAWAAHLTSRLRICTSRAAAAGGRTGPGTAAATWASAPPPPPSTNETRNEQARLEASATSVDLPARGPETGGEPATDGWLQLTSHPEHGHTRGVLWWGDASPLRNGTGFRFREMFSFLTDT